MGPLGGDIQRQLSALIASGLDHDNGASALEWLKHTCRFFFVTEHISSVCLCTCMSSSLYLPLDIFGIHM